MTRYAIDAATAARLVLEDVSVAGHQLVGPASLKSQVMGLLYAGHRAGELGDADAKAALRRLAELKIRLLGDRVSRQTAWRHAARLGWADTADAEYLAVAELQADALVTLDERLIAAASGVVPIATYDDLLR